MQAAAVGLGILQDKETTSNILGLAGGAISIGLIAFGILICLIGIFLLVVHSWGAGIGALVVGIAMVMGTFFMYRIKSK